MTDDKIVYGHPFGTLIMIPEKTAKDVRQVFTALKTARTWGEFQLMMPTREFFERYLKNSSHYRGPTETVKGQDLSKYYITASKPFSPNDVLNLEDWEDVPYHAEIEMSAWVPQQIQGEFGSKTHYYAMDMDVPPGEVLMIEQDQTEAVIQKMGELGYTCVEDQELVADACTFDLNPEDYPSI